MGEDTQVKRRVRHAEARTERAREELANDIHALTQKLDVRRQVAHRKEAMVSRAKDKIPFTGDNGSVTDAVDTDAVRDTAREWADMRAVQMAAVAAGGALVASLLRGRRDTGDHDDYHLDEAEDHLHGVVSGVGSATALGSDLSRAIRRLAGDVRSELPIEKSRSTGSPLLWIGLGLLAAGAAASYLAPKVAPGVRDKAAGLGGKLKHGGSSAGGGADNSGDAASRAGRVEKTGSTRFEGGVPAGDPVTPGAVIGSGGATGSASSPDIS